MRISEQSEPCPITAWDYITAKTAKIPSMECLRIVVPQDLQERFPEAWMGVKNTRFSTPLRRHVIVLVPRQKRHHLDAVQ